MTTMQDKGLIARHALLSRSRTSNSHPSSISAARGLVTIGLCIAIGATCFVTVRLEGRATPAYGQDAGKPTFKVPQTEDATYLGDKRADAIDEIPGKETIVKFYQTNDGARFATLSILNKAGEARVYAIKVDTNGAPPFEYNLVDFNGDGKFSKVPIGKFVADGWILEFHQRG